MDKNRLEMFSDGVIAIIITIMVLEFKVPHGSRGVRRARPVDRKLTHNQVCLVMRDGGSEFPAEAIAHLFKRHNHADTLRHDASGGSGLGLSLVNVFIELYDGTVQTGNAIAGGAYLEV